MMKTIVIFSQKIKLTGLSLWNRYCVAKIRLHLSAYLPHTFSDEDFQYFPICHTVWRHVKILTNYCDRQTINQITARDLWKNRLYFALSSQSKNSCLTIDCRKSDPPKYRTEADNFTIMAKIKRTGFTINF